MADEEKSEISIKCRQLKLTSKDGKRYTTETLDTKGILRLIESVISNKNSLSYEYLEDNKKLENKSTKLT